MARHDATAVAAVATATVIWTEKARGKARQNAKKSPKNIKRTKRTGSAIAERGFCRGRMI